MKKSTLSLVVAGMLAVGGLAQAETISYSSPVVVDTTVLGAAPATVMVPMERDVYVRPGWHDTYRQRHEAAATFNVPARAGEASTMTGGAPNVATDNERLAANRYVGVYSVPEVVYYGF
jgi:hypothetical protein